MSLVSKTNSLPLYYIPIEVVDIIASYSDDLFEIEAVKQAAGQPFQVVDYLSNYSTTTPESCAFVFKSSFLLSATEPLLDLREKMVIKLSNDFSEVRIDDLHKNQCIVHDRPTKDCPLLRTTCSEMMNFVIQESYHHHFSPLGQFLLVKAIFEVAKKAIDTNSVVVIKQLANSPIAMDVFAKNYIPTKEMGKYALAQNRVEILEKVLVTMANRSNNYPIQRALREMYSSPAEKNLLRAIVIDGSIKHRLFSLLRELPQLIGKEIEATDLERINNVLDSNGIKPPK